MTARPVASGPPPVPNPGRFLLVFAVFAGLFLLAWSHLSGYYLTGLVALANAALAALAVPLILNAPAAPGSEIVHPAVIGAVALFAATPRRSLRWRATWLGLVLAGLGLLHTSLLVGEAWQVYAPSASTAGALAALSTPFTQILGLAEEWGSLLAVVTTWFAALRRGQRPASISDD